MNSQSIRIDHLRVIQHILHQSFLIIRSHFSLDSIQRIDDISHSSSSRPTTNGKDAELEANVLEIWIRAEIEANCDITRIVSEDSNILGCLERKSVVSILEQYNASGTKFTN